MADNVFYKSCLALVEVNVKIIIFIKISSFEINKVDSHYILNIPEQKF